MINITTTIRNGIEIAIIQSDELLITDVQSALDLIASIGYEKGCCRMVMNKEAIIESFFTLSSRFAGEILQKFINYKMKIAIIGDFSCYTSKPLKDFIYESNHGKDVFFVSTVEEAIERLTFA